MNFGPYISHSESGVFVEAKIFLMNILMITNFVE